MTRIAQALRTHSLSGVAQMLQKAGRHGDTILAHITPKEAAKLKRDGGAGTINPVTGLPEFYELGGGYTPEIDTSMYVPPSQLYTPDFAPQQSAQVPAEQQYGGEFPGVQGSYGGNKIPTANDLPPEFANFVVDRLREQQTAGGAQLASAIPVAERAPVAPGPVSAGSGAAPVAPAPKSDDEGKPGFFQKALAQLQDPATLAKLGLGIGGVGLGLSQQAGARRQAAGTQQQYAALGAPYQAQGREMMDAARRGELTPQSQQAYQAAQAQIQQGIAARGGVGAQQAAAVLGDVYQKLLDNQYSLGMNVARVGDTYAAQGISAGLQANQQLQQITSNYYATLMRMFGGMPSLGGSQGATP